MSGEQYVSLCDATFNDDHGPLDLREFELHRLPYRVKGGSDFGAVLVRLKVDDQRDQVFLDLTQTGTYAAVREAARVLDRLADQLWDLLGEDGKIWPGRCFAIGDWGRCFEDDGHEGDHRFPTKSEVLADLRFEVRPTRATPEV